MTNREFFESVVANNITEEVIAHAQESIVKMDERNAKRAAKPSKTAVANAPIKEQIHEYLYGEDGAVHTASEIAEVVGISTQKSSALCRQLVADGILSAEEVKVKGKGKVKCYKLV